MDCASHRSTSAASCFVSAATCNIIGQHDLDEVRSASNVARIIKAEAELEASRKLGDAAEQMANNPVAVELRRMQMVTEVGAENNSTTVLMIPSD